jgi:hypothetical protein
MCYTLALFVSKNTVTNKQPIQREKYRTAFSVVTKNNTVVVAENVLHIGFICQQKHCNKQTTNSESSNIELLFLL